MNFRCLDAIFDSSAMMLVMKRVVECEIVRVAVIVCRNARAKNMDANENVQLPSDLAWSR